MCVVTIVCAVTRLRPGPGPWYAARVPELRMVQCSICSPHSLGPLYAAVEERTDTAYRAVIK